MLRQDFYHPNMNTRVRLDEYISDLNLEISPEGYSCQPLCKDGFAYMWAGAKATFGIRKGKVCYEVKVAENLEVSTADFTDIHVVRVGWSTDAATLQLGEDKNSFGYGGTAKKSEARRFIDYGRRFDKGDVIGCYLAIENGWADISYCVNGRHCGSAFKVRWNADEALYPHILSKNCRLEVNFGQAPNPYFSLLPGYKLIEHLPVELRVPAISAPKSKHDCEVIMMVGLPGVGKSTWATNYSKIHPSKKYNILGTDAIIDKMRVQGLPRKNNFGGRWDVLIKQASECFNALLKKASNCNRNLILDQTNVYSSARKRKVRQYKDAGYTVNAMVLVPTDEDMMRRSHQRTLEEGKEVPEAAVYDMKANFSLPHENEKLFSKITFLELQREEAENLVLQYNSDANMKGYKSNKQSGVGANENQKEKNESDRRAAGSTSDRRDYHDTDRASRSYERSDDSRHRSDSRRHDSPRRDRYRERSPERSDRRERKSRWENSKESPRYETKKRIEDDRGGGPPEKYRRDGSPSMTHQLSAGDSESRMPGSVSQGNGRFQNQGPMARNTQQTQQESRYGPGRNNYTPEEVLPQHQPTFKNNSEIFPSPSIQNQRRYPAPQDSRRSLPNEQSRSQDMDWEYRTDGNNTGLHKQSYNAQQSSSQRDFGENDSSLGVAKPWARQDGPDIQRRPPVHEVNKEAQQHSRNRPVTGGPGAGRSQTHWSEYGQMPVPNQQREQQQSFTYQNNSKSGQIPEYDSSEYYGNEYADNYDQNYSGHDQGQQHMKTDFSHPDEREETQYKDEYVGDDSYYDSQEQHWNQDTTYSEPTRRSGSVPQFGDKSNVIDPNENWRKPQTGENYDQYYDGDEHQYQGDSPANTPANHSYDPNFARTSDHHFTSEGPPQYSNPPQVHGDVRIHRGNSATNRMIRPPIMQIRHPSNQVSRPRMPLQQGRGGIHRPQIHTFNTAVRPTMKSNIHTRGRPLNTNINEEPKYDVYSQQQENAPIFDRSSMPNFSKESQLQGNRAQLLARPHTPALHRPLLRGESANRPRQETPMRFRGPRPGPPLGVQHSSDVDAHTKQVFSGRESVQQAEMARQIRPPHPAREGSFADSTIQKLTGVDFDNLKASLANIRQAQQLEIKSDSKRPYEMTDQEIFGEHMEDVGFAGGDQNLNQHYPSSETENQYPRNDDHYRIKSQRMRGNERPPMSGERDRDVSNAPHILQNRKQPLLPLPKSDDIGPVGQFNNPYDSRNTMSHPPIERSNLDRMQYNSQDRIRNRKEPHLMQPSGGRDGQQQVMSDEKSQRPNFSDPSIGTSYTKNRPLLPNPEKNRIPVHQRPPFNAPDLNQPRHSNQSDQTSSVIAERPRLHESPHRKSPHSRERSKTRERRSERDSKSRHVDDKVDSKDRRDSSKDSRSGKDSRSERDSRDSRNDKDSRSKRESSRHGSREQDNNKKDSDSRRTRDRDRSSRRRETRWEPTERKSPRSRSPARKHSPSLNNRNIPVRDIEKIKSELELERAMLQAKKEAMEQAKREMYDEPAQNAGEWDQLTAVQSLLMKEKASIGVHNDILPSLLDLPVNEQRGLLGAHPSSLEPKLRFPSELPSQLLDSAVRIRGPQTPFAIDAIRHQIGERPMLHANNSSHGPRMSLLGSPHGPPGLEKNRASDHEGFGRIPMRLRSPLPRPALLDTPILEPMDGELIMESDDMHDFQPDIQQISRPRVRGPRPGMPRGLLRVRNPRPIGLEPTGLRPPPLRLRGPRPRLRMGSPGSGEEVFRLMRPEGARPPRMRFQGDGIVRRPIRLPAGQRFHRPMRPRFPLDHEEGPRGGMFRMARPAYQQAQRPRRIRPRFVGNNLM
ncbi:uncharacterized protein LOC120346575 isoform X2 [Styela clava]